MEATESQEEDWHLLDNTELPVEGIARPFLFEFYFAIVTLFIF